MKQNLEISGTIEEGRRLILDEEIPVWPKGKVRGILFLEDDEVAEEAAWLRAVAKNPAFASLADPEEDIYSVEDGKPFDAEGYSHPGAVSV